LIGAASLLPHRQFSQSARRARFVVLGAPAGFVVLTLLFVMVLAVVKPQMVLAAALTEPHGHPFVVDIQLALAATYAVAAFGFYRRNQRTGDELSAWLAIGSILASAARVNYFVYPSLYSKWVYSGDVFRLGFYLMLLVGAAREIASYWASTVEAAQLEERRRIARDLHDGLAQEIAFIGRNAALLHDENGNGELVDRIVAASERARAESRSVIAALTSRLDEPLDRALAEAAREAEARYGTSVELRLPALVILPPARREGLIRIASEAITNAARHSGSTEVRVELEQHNGSMRLRIVDRGRGFDADEPRANGFGLVSMKERAEALGGHFQIRSKPGRGTQVEVVL
jgi:signal transduction histidine kinase